MNPLDQYPAIRQALYLVQWLTTGAQTVLATFFAFQMGTPDDWPRWFLATLAVTPVLWAYLGITAQTNTTVAPTTGPGEHHAKDGLYLERDQ